MTIDSVNIAEALRYMGHEETEASENLKSVITKCEKNLLEAIRPEYTYRCFDINITENGVDICKTSFILKGNDIKNHLLNCQKAVLMCATLGIDSDKLMRRLAITDMSEHFVTDALASALIEQVCDNAEREIKDKFPDWYMTWRFSPGYGDFPIEQQADFLNVTNAAKRIGLYLSEGGMMIPSKSVTAVIGLSETQIKQDKQSCACCNMSDRCSFRKRGKHCGV